MGYFARGVRSDSTSPHTSVECKCAISRNASFLSISYICWIVLSQKKKEKGIKRCLRSMVLRSSIAWTFSIFTKALHVHQGVLKAIHRVNKLPRIDESGRKNGDYWKGTKCNFIIAWEQVIGSSWAFKSNRLHT